jgi:triosephosphate isomerase
MTAPRPKLIAGNWKMYKTLRETEELINGLKSLLPALPAHVGAIVCPPYTSLMLAKQLLQGSPIKLGAQNMHTEDEGAFTGEISPKMLAALGCDYVILGHSERRQYFGEKDDLINRKAKKAFASGLIPIVCVGETLQEREANITEQVVAKQVRGCFDGFTADQMRTTVVAYEPVWAIGTGKTASPQQAQDVHQFIRKTVGELFGADLAGAVVIQYGGSVKPENAKELLSQRDIDGALVGGACLKADSFAAIVKATA